jgi:hypothetical protein
MVIELPGGEVAELILHPDHPLLGANLFVCRETGFLSDYRCNRPG